MDARNSLGRFERAALIALATILLVGLWQAYGHWLLVEVQAHVP